MEAQKRRLILLQSRVMIGETMEQNGQKLNSGLNLLGSNFGSDTHFLPYPLLSSMVK